jgi:hypothetical protein
VTRLAALVCLVASAAHAVDVVDVDRAFILAKGGQTIEVDGGVWLSDEFSKGFAKEVVGKRVETAETAKPVPPGWVFVTVVIVALTAFAGGVAVGHH